MKLKEIFTIRREEKFPVLLFFLWQLTLQIMVIAKYYNVFSQIRKEYNKIILDTFGISGFDPLTCVVVSDWRLSYDIVRHPLLAPFYYPLYLVNKGLMLLTGVNCMHPLIAIVLLFCSVFGFIFLIRIGREVIKLSQGEAVILATMFYAFAYVLLASISPDHFIISAFLLLLTLYISGLKIETKTLFSKRTTILLFIITAGTTLNNGLKIFMANFMCNRKRFFRPANLILAILLPGALMLYFGKWEDNTFREPQRKERRQKERKFRAKERAQMLAIFRDTTQIRDTAEQSKVFQKIWIDHRKAQIAKKNKKPVFAHAGKPITKKFFLSWSDISTPRIPSIVENLFGEGLQLHQKNTLQDVLRNRPIIVQYSATYNYIVEGVLFLLFVAGIWAGRRKRFLWLVLSFFALDMVLHLGLGFGLNEVYIMTAHWAYAIPIAIGYLLCTLRGKTRKRVTILVAGLTAYLLVYNTTLFVSHFL